MGEWMVGRLVRVGLTEEEIGSVGVMGEKVGGAI